MRRYGSRALVVLLAASISTPWAAGHLVERVSVSHSGGDPNAASTHPSISANGRFVAFESQANNLVVGDTNNRTDVFVRDRRKGLTAPVTSGPQPNNGSRSPSISANGQAVAFHSWADNLVPSDWNGTADVFVSTGGTVRLASLSDAGGQSAKGSYFPSVSANGRYVAFVGFGDDLVEDDNNGQPDVFVRDTAAGRTYLVSLAGDSSQANGTNRDPSISDDGTLVAFASWATNLVSGDANNAPDIFVRNWRGGQTWLVSGPSSLTVGNGRSSLPEISGDGRFVAFGSEATNLVRQPIRDSNGFKDIFARDYRADRTYLASVTYLGYGQANDDCLLPSISADGRFVAFHSAATNLVRQGTNSMTQVYVGDCRSSGAQPFAYLVSTTMEGYPRESSAMPSISGDGKWVAFASTGALVPDDRNRNQDIYVGANPAFAEPPKLSWSPKKGFRSRGVKPLRVKGPGSFWFRVVVTDDQGDQPEYVRLFLRKDGKVWQKTDLESYTGDMETGREYRVMIDLGVGNWSYRFAARDRDGEATGPPTEWRRGPIMTSAPPYLTWAGEAGYTTDGVHPNRGDSASTYFRFKVKYVSHTGYMPKYVRVRLWRNGTPSRKGAYRLPTGGTDPHPPDGIIYRKAWRLPPGSYEYRFEAADDHGKAVGPASQRKRGPISTEGGSSSAVTSLVAVPTRAGAQIAFTLSSAARVDARVINIAGRPVAAICRARDCEAGTNTVLWDARSDQGLPVPGGTYLVEVVARSEDGAQARALGQVRINR